MPFVKLDCGILDSTLWVQPAQREIFITSLLMAMPYETKIPLPQLEVRSLERTGFIVSPGWYGFVAAAGVGIIRRAQIDENIGLDALEALGSPDQESRSPEHDGRRLVRVDGGYIVLNYQKYRDRDYTGAERARRYRERKLSSHRDSTASHRDITQAEAEAEGYISTSSKTGTSARSRFVKPQMIEIKAYCADRKNDVDPQSFHDYYESNGWKVGRNSMKDWKAAVRTWEKNQRKPNGKDQRIDNSAIGQVRAANKRARDAQRRADAAGVGENDHDVRAPLEVKLRG